MAQYDRDFIDRLHLVWGEGWLSPGGDAEVAEILRGLDLRGARVLDIGCGTGGAAIALARDFGARPIAIDVEPAVIDHARRLAERAGLSREIEFRLVRPGPLRFDAGRFDLVFSKDALIHIPDKAALFADILRVLKPGGVFAASDWLSGEGETARAALRRYTETTHLGFAPATAEATAEAMREAGFADVETRDRNAWYATRAAEELAAIEGDLREEIIALSGREAWEEWRRVRRALAEAVAAGGLRPTHLRGRRPE